MRKKTLLILIFFQVFIALMANNSMAAEGGQAGKKEAVNENLQKAIDQLEIAIKQADLSLGPHQPGSGWTKKHMQSLINVIEGKEGLDFRENMENPGDGTGVIHYLNNSKIPSNPIMDETLSHALTFIHEAIHHARESVTAKTIDETHEHALMAAGMLIAALGNRQMDSPVTGGIHYALRLADSIK
ncbi:MAG: hypothetical protein ACYDBV_08045 [Nitrospiria bacterium]